MLSGTWKHNKKKTKKLAIKKIPETNPASELHIMKNHEMGSRWGMGKGPQTPRIAHVLPFHVTKEKKKKWKTFLRPKMHLWTVWRVFFRFLVTRKLYPTSADQTLRRFESGNQAWGFTVCLKVTKNKYLLPPPCCLVRQHLVLHPVLCGHSRHWNLCQRLL